MNKQSLQDIIKVIDENIDSLEKLSSACEKKNPTLAASLQWMVINMKYTQMLYKHALSKE